MKSINKKELHSIFEGIVNKQEKDFNLLYKEYNKLIYAIAFSILKNEENSKDIMQIVFEKIWNMEVDKLPNSNESSWLYSLTKNEAISFLRKERNTIDIEEVYYISDSQSVDAIIEKEDYNRIISRLDEKEQEIVTLKLLSKLSFKEISEILNIPIGTVQWRYYKALHILKMLLSSLSIFIVTTVAFVIQRTMNNKEYIEQELPKQENEENDKYREQEGQEEQKKNEEQKGEEENKTENSAESSKDETNIITNEVVNKTENYIILEQKSNMELGLVDISLISISSIFLVITIIFLTFFIKHQQKGKKKASK